MQIVNFISLIFWIVLGLISLIYAIYRKDYNIVKKMIFSLVTEAEKAYGGGTGVLKLASVITAIYPKLPKLFKALVTEKKLVSIIEDVLSEAKKKWDSNKKLLEESEEK